MIMYNAKFGYMLAVVSILEQFFYPKGNLGRCDRFCHQKNKMFMTNTAEKRHIWLHIYNLTVHRCLIYESSQK